MKYSRVAGTGSFLPGPPISNLDLAARGIDTDDAWIVTRTGIRTRHLAEPGVMASDLGLEAARRALAMAAVDPAAIDLIIVATSTPDFIFPSTACLIQGKLGNKGATAFDVQAVCAGFAYALAIADKFIASGSHCKALVIGTEVFSRILDWQDRGTCVLFGDGAGALVLEASDAPGILASALHADGSQSGILNVPGQISGGRVCGDPFLRMDGQAVFKFAVRVLAEVAEEVCAQAGVPAAGIDWLIPHQANIRIIEATGKKLGVDRERVIVTVDHHGNTSAASIPLALDEAVRDGRIRSGQKVLVEGVGGGFTWGAALMQF
ncbi:MAG TPA: beta-ketoacyl-ACP synthase III [Rhodocyclaceae bacterium]|nr:beta-ketoacyl-ACP synthase III [Rhodocyclaceae bacterium]HMV20787.1 beta-ketoacyl-ACP synthase III [Rhodocyclaceae bacterium]HNE42551.1 beta-ketoacyl-ACP synthase III [Rhodocyclaceae bacterium]HNL22730.1 beta-ketoacyl-ACP synthase III [Rhodocyclaceae bacterium]HNM21958.1 beta-ketoacyl-ACP synthase III [Rhodocyclaceae bacterium]